MPKITAYAGTFRDWEGLIGACLKNLALLPGLEGLRTALEGLLSEAREIKIQQEDLTGRRQAMTQRLNMVVDEGRETARKLRALVIAELGTRSEQLPQFGITPNRKKSRKATAAETPPPVQAPDGKGAS